MAVTTSFLGRGIYSVQSAARLSGIPIRRVRRWLCGYSFVSSGKARRSPPVWIGDFAPIETHASLSFLDLIELRFVESFIRAGVSWKTMRLAHQKASEYVKSPHPFCTNAFATDGRKIFADLKIAADQKGIVEVISKQRYFDQVIRPLLLQLDFSSSHYPLRWWPLGTSRHVVLDPNRCFGTPITEREATPTRSLYLAVQAGNAPRQVASWYGVSPKAVADAIEFERNLAA